MRRAMVVKDSTPQAALKSTRSTRRAVPVNRGGDRVIDDGGRRSTAGIVGDGREQHADIIAIAEEQVPVLVLARVYDLEHLRRFEGHNPDAGGCLRLDVDAAECGPRDAARFAAEIKGQYGRLRHGAARRGNALHGQSGIGFHRMPDPVEPARIVSNESDAWHAGTQCGSCCPTPDLFTQLAGKYGNRARAGGAASYSAAAGPTASVRSARRQLMLGACGENPCFAARPRRMRQGRGLHDPVFMFTVLSSAISAA